MKSWIDPSSRGLLNDFCEKSFFCTMLWYNSRTFTVESFTIPSIFWSLEKLWNPSNYTKSNFDQKFFYWSCWRGGGVANWYYVQLSMGYVLVGLGFWQWNLKTLLFLLFFFPEIINNDVKNNINARANNEEQKPQIYHLKNLVD